MNKNCWFEKGLRFKCTGCGKCCTGAPGFVWVSEEEICKIAKHLQLSVEDFAKKYLRQIGDRYSLIDDPKNYDCIFLKDNKCSIYELRPKQCMTFPFWPQNLQSQDAWQEVECEGISEDAPLIPKSEIEKRL